MRGGPGQSASFNGEAQIEFPGLSSAIAFAVAFWMRSGAARGDDGAGGWPGFDIGVTDSHPQPDEKRGSPLYVGIRRHAAGTAQAIVYGCTMAPRRIELSRTDNRRSFCSMANPRA